jgi:hypothetical protein
MITKRHDSSCGILLHEGKKFKVLNRPISESLIDKYDEYSKNTITVIEEIWMFHTCKWEIRKNKLYLTEMFQSHLLRLFTNKNFMLATWVDKLLLHRATEVLMSSKKDNRKEKLYYSDLRFDNANLVSKKISISSSYTLGMYREINYKGVQEGIFTFDIKDVCLSENLVLFDSNDDLIPYLENDIFGMLKKSNQGVKLDIKDFSRVLQSSSKVTYVCYELSTHKNRQTMMDNLNSIVDKIDTIVDKKPANYLVHIEIDHNFNFEMVRIFMERLYDLCSDDSTVLMGINEHKKIKLSKKKKKKNYMYVKEKKVPCAVFKIIIGID